MALSARWFSIWNLMCLFPPEWPLVWGDCDWQGALLNWKGRNLLSLPFSSHSSRLEIWCNMMQQRIWYLNNFWIYLISLAHFGSSQGRSVGCFSAFIFPWRQEAKDPPRQSSVVDFWQSCVDPVRIDMWWYVMICIIVSYWCHIDAMLSHVFSFWFVWIQIRHAGRDARRNAAAAGRIWWCPISVLFADADSIR